MTPICGMQPLHSLTQTFELRASQSSHVALLLSCSAKS
jgi:hypothetical protein